MSLNGNTIKDQKVATPNRKIPVSTKTNAQIEDRLIKARIKMLISQPFFGNLATRLQLREASKWCPTAGTDGRYFYYNRDFTDALTDNELVFLMGHEVEHCVYDHMSPARRGSRNPRLWNIACDYVINNDLVEAGVGEMITLVDICYDRKYAGMSANEVYELLLQENPNAETLDYHLVQGDYSEEDGPEVYTDAEREQISREFMDATIAAAKAAGAGAGKIPGGIGRLIDSLVNPKVDWREYLAMDIQSIIRSDYTWLRPSRKGQESGFYMPSMDRAKSIDVAIAIDTSGSISGEMLRDMLSEVNGIMSQYSEYKIQIWCFDTAVHNPKVFTSDSGADILEYEMAGFGGTDFMVNWEFMKENDIVPKKFIMFTDGYPYSSWGDPDYCDTLFIVHGAEHGAVPQSPFGVTVPYSSSAGV